LVTILALGVALAAAFASGSLTLVELLTPGGLGPAAPLIVEDFGPDHVDPDLTGYDGQQVYAIARQFPDLDAASESLDKPAYRMLRIVPPAIASIAPPGAPTVLALLVLNVLGIGAGVYAGARLVERAGGPPLLAVPAAAVLLLGVATTTVGPVAWGLTMLGIDLALRRKHTAAVAILLLAALSRETAAFAAGCIGVGLWLDGVPVRRAAMYLAPGISVLAWYAALTRLVDDAGIPTRSDPLAFLALDGAEAALVAAVAAIGAAGALAWWRYKAVALCALAFTSWIVVYTEDVLDPIAILRVNALPIMLGVLGVGVLIGRRHGHDPGVAPAGRT
jgi:hypothetical protein